MTNYTTKELKVIFNSDLQYYIYIYIYIWLPYSLDNNMMSYKYNPKALTQTLTTVDKDLYQA